MIEQLDKIFEAIGEIQAENDTFGQILMVNFRSALNTADALKNGVPMDVSEKVIMLSNLLGLDINDLIKEIIDRDFVNNHGTIVNSDEADAETLDFILGNSGDINNKNSVDQYEEFLSKNDIKEDLEFLKGEL